MDKTKRFIRILAIILVVIIGRLVFVGIIRPWVYNMLFIPDYRRDLELPPISGIYVNRENQYDTIKLYPDGVSEQSLYNTRGELVFHSTTEWVNTTYGLEIYSVMLFNKNLDNLPPFDEDNPLEGGPAVIEYKKFKDGSCFIYSLEGPDEPLESAVVYERIVDLEPKNIDE